MKIKYVFTVFTHLESVRSKAETLARLFMCFGAHFDKNWAFYDHLKWTSGQGKEAVLGTNPYHFYSVPPENWKIPVPSGKSIDKKCFYHLHAISKCALEKWGLGASFDVFFIFFGAKLHILEPLEMRKRLEKIGHFKHKNSCFYA